MATVTEIISLNRSAKIRVKSYDGTYKNLATTTSRWIDLNDSYNRKQLNHHASIGQYLTINQAASSSNPSDRDLTVAQPYVAIKSLSKGSKVRVKGFRNSTEEYGFYDLGRLIKENPEDAVWINLGADDGNPDPNDGAYNRRQLNHHRSIGQYVQATNVNYVGIRALNRSVKIRVKDSSDNIVKLGTSGYVWINTGDRETLRLLNHHSAIGQWIVNEFND